MLTRCLALLPLAVVLGACGDGSGPGNLSGSMSFAYTGAGGGTFSVSGAAPTLSANIGASSWAAGHRDDAATQLGVFGIRARSGGRYDMFVVGISRLTVGSVSVEADCDPDLGEACSGFVFLTNVSDTDQNYDFLCIPTTGTLAITSISDTRARGSFTGSGNCIDGATDAISSFTVSNGAFDVALLLESQFPQ